MKRLTLVSSLFLVLFTLFAPTQEAVAGDHGVSVEVGNVKVRVGGRRRLLRRRGLLRGSIRFAGRAAGRLALGAARVAGGVLRGAARAVGFFGRALFGYSVKPVPAMPWDYQTRVLRA